MLDVVDLSGSRRDQFIAFQLFHNMAMCYQKQGQLEECALCLETTLDGFKEDRANKTADKVKKETDAMLGRLSSCASLAISNTFTGRTLAARQDIHRTSHCCRRGLDAPCIAHRLDCLSTCLPATRCR